jgi:serine/threonine-protein kinase
MAEEGSFADQIVAGKYRVTTMVGRGGMGSVWEGVHLTLGTRVAIKFIDSEHAKSKEAQSRFVNEARAAAKLRSKHVVQVYDHGITEDGRPYIVMEFLAGEPLDRRLDRLGALALQETASIIGQICRALSRAHEAGIVHRDLKPENVFIIHDEDDAHEVVKVVDFGIAKFTDNALGMSSATRTGSVLGTPYYMSPEQARGLRSVDHRADLWSIGVIAFRCVAGRLPFEGEAIGDLLVKICTAPLPVPSQSVPGLPPAFDAWFARALGREPSERFQSALELADGLAQVAGLSPVRAPMSSIEASGGYPAPAATPWQPGMPTPHHDSSITAQPAALTGAPITTQSQTLQSTSSGKGLLFAALGVAGLVGLVVVVLIVRFALGSGASAEPAAAASATGSGAAVIPPPEPPVVSPSVEATADAAAGDTSKERPAETAAKPAPAEKPPVSSAGTAPTKPPVGRPKPKDPNDVLGY